MLDELKIRYKQSKLPVRLLICAIVAIIPATMHYMDESSAVDEEFGNVENQEKAAAQKLVQAENTLKNLPKAESELAFTREQLKKAEGLLPDSIAVDEILRSIGKSSKTFGVNVVLFEPQPEVIRGDTYKYSEVPFKISIQGNDYGQICEWLDEVAGTKSKIYLKSWKLSRKAGKSDQDPNSQTANSANKQNSSAIQVAEQNARLSRESLRLFLETEVSVFKMATSAQLLAPKQPADPKKPEPANQKAAPNAQGPSKQPTVSGNSTEQKHVEGVM